MRSIATSRSSRSRPTRWTPRFPSPAAGVLTEIKVKEGETVAVNAVVATIGEAAEVVHVERASPGAAVQADGSRPAADSKSPATAPSRNGREAAATSAASCGSGGGQSRGRAPAEVVAARPPHREGAQRRRLADSRDPASAAASRSTTSSGISKPGPGIAGAEIRPASRIASRSPSPTPSARIPIPDPGPRSRRDRAALGDAQEDRRAHGAEPAHVGARALGLPCELLDGRADPRSRRRREYEQLGAKLTYMAFIAKAVIDALRRHPDRQRLARRRQHRLQEGHQPRHRRRARRRA